MSNLNRAIFGGFRQLGITDEADQRALYQRAAGKPSLRDMTPAEQEAVVVELRRLGFTAKPGRRPDGRRKLTGKYRAKLQALWIAGYNLGVIRNRDDAAMLVFIKDQAGVDDTRFLHEHAAATAAIEGLKAWLATKGGVVWKIQPNAPDWAHADGYRIAKAQWQILSPSGANDFWPIVTDLLDRPTIDRDFSATDWVAVMNLLGERVRRQKALTR